MLFLVFKKKLLKSILTSELLVCFALFFPS